MLHELGFAQALQVIGRHAHMPDVFFHQSEILMLRVEDTGEVERNGLPVETQLLHRVQDVEDAFGSFPEVVNWKPSWNFTR